MHKCLVFDMDGTLAPIGGATPDECIKKLHKLEEKGYRIILCSGKSSDYLCGYMRQVELKDPVMISENGGTIYYGNELPPEKYIELSCTDKELEQINLISGMITKKFGEDTWQQPSRVIICVFSSKKYILDELQEFFDEQKDNMTELVIHRHPDCFDVLPKTINKKAGLLRYSREEGLDPKEFIAIGDSSNDTPMFEFADISISIGNAMKDATDLNFPDLSSVLDHILSTGL